MVRKSTWYRCLVNTALEQAHSIPYPSYMSFDYVQDILIESFLWHDKIPLDWHELWQNNIWNRKSLRETNKELLLLNCHIVTNVLNIFSNSLICFLENSLNSVYGLKTAFARLSIGSTSSPSLIWFLRASFLANSSVSLIVNAKFKTTTTGYSKQITRSDLYVSVRPS